jgi:signal transduction histidine kinase
MEAQAVLTRTPVEPSGLRKFWQFLTRPHPSITDIEQRRQTRLLAGLMIALFLATSLASILLMRRSGGVTSTIVSVWVGIVVIAVLFVLNRKGHYRLSASLFVLQNFLLIYTMPPVTHELTWFFFSGMVLLFGAILLSGRAMVLIYVAGIAIDLVYLAVDPMASMMSVFAATVVFGITGLIILVFMNHRIGLEGERREELQAANAQLREHEALLEKRVAERTRELQAANEQLRAIDEMKSQFLASMSHELRTPLNAVLNFTEFVSLGLMGPVNDKQKDALGKSLDSARYLLALINDVLDMTKIEAGMMKLFVEDNVHISDEMLPVVATAQTLLKDRHVQFISDIDEGLPPLVGDRRRIRQIMLNLISNACKFTEQGSVTLSVKNRGDELLFAVIDTGPGIAQEDQAIIFEPFRQTETGIKHMGGTGLGLPISKRLVEAHGGRIWLESVPGEGASFFVTLPLHSEALLAQLKESKGNA